MGSSSSSRPKVRLEVVVEAIIPRALSYEEAKLLASARGEERKRLMKLFMGEPDGQAQV
jgi:hypothetical protein